MQNVIIYVRVLVEPFNHVGFARSAQLIRLNLNGFIWYAVLIVCSVCLPNLLRMPFNFDIIDGIFTIAANIGRLHIGNVLWTDAVFDA